MIDGTKTLSFRGHILDGLSVVLVRAEPHKGYVTESVRGAQRHSANKPDFRGMENLVT